MVDLTDPAFARVLGHEIRRAREERGWTRAQLVEKLPSGIGDRTLLSYEHGIRHVTVCRFVEIIRTLGDSASEVLAKALERADDLRGRQLHVNLRRLVKDEKKGFESVRKWAKNRLAHYPSPIVLLSPHTLRELSVALDLTHTELTSYLIEFCPAD